MEIPVLTRFIEGLKLFFASKRLKWLTLIFFIDATLAYILERVVATFPAGANAALALAALFPFFWMIVTILSLLGLQHFVASEESYARSGMLTVIMFIVSLILYIITLVFAGILLLVITFAGFFVWIGFQGYFSTQTSLGFATSIDHEHRSKAMTVFFGIANIFNYVIIIGAAIVTYFILYPFQAPPLAIGGALVGILIASIFNFINGILVTSERNREGADNLALLGLFISLYSGYFIYNVLKGADLGIDIVGVAVTVFFLLYTMSGVGRTLASRAETESRFKLSKELAATFTFFLASCYVFVDVMFTILLANAGHSPTDIAPVSDIIKLWIFPFIALAVEIRFVMCYRKMSEAPEMTADTPVVLDDAPLEEKQEPDEPETIEEPIEADMPPDEPIEIDEVPEPEEDDI